MRKKIPIDMIDMDLTDGLTKTGSEYNKHEFNKDG